MYFSEAVGEVMKLFYNETDLKTAFHKLAQNFF